MADKSFGTTVSRHYYSFSIFNLKHYLSRCDADPAALAKYVLALIKKEKPKDELKESMVQQMDVFLQSETNSFIDMLFKVVEAKEYLEAANESLESKITMHQDFDYS